ncbi:MAG: phage major capsid protein [Roseimicrobium sp.]
MHRALLTLALVTAIASSSAPLSAQEANPMEAMMKRMRETLRNTMIQLQTAQAEVATLQAKQVEQETQIKELGDKVVAITKKADADKADAAKLVKEKEAKIATQATEITTLNATLEKWKDGYKKAAEVANATEAKRSKLASQIVLLDRQVADQKAKNQQMYKIGSEVLRRYEKFGLGTALLNREPFTGIARAKFETLVQDFHDQLDDSKIQPEELKGSKTAPGTPNAEGAQKAPATTASAAPAPAQAPAAPERQTPLPKAKS